MGITPVVPSANELRMADIDADVRKQMNEELDENATTVQRNMLMQKYGLAAPVFTAAETTVIENRKKLEAKRSRRAARD
jgi:hypothetical protein